MKTTQKFLLATFCILFTLTSNAQRAKDGDYIASISNEVVNTYTYLTLDAIAGATTIAVNNNSMIGGVFGGALAPGDLILIIQMQGAAINVNITPALPVTQSTPADGPGWGGNYTAPNPYLWTFDWFEHIENWGEITSYGNSGKFEKVEVLSVSGAGTINLNCGLENTYDQLGKVQIVRIPRFNNLTVSGGLNSIVPTLWDGQTGGVVAVEIEATLDVNGGSSISASGFGFRGGETDPIGTVGDPNAPTNVTFLGTPDAIEGSEKGESIFGYHTELDAVFSRYGISGAANAGGGGGYTNCGGGGGSNIGVGIYTGNGVPDPTYNVSWALDLSHPPFPTGSPLPAPGFTALSGTASPGGGRGGYALSDWDLDELTLGPRLTIWGGDARKTNGGRGGHPLTYDATRTFSGGGGGSGDQDSDEAGGGGRGGGLVFVTCYGSIIGSGVVPGVIEAIIEANGEAGQNSNPFNLPVSGANARRGNDGAGGGGGGGSIYIENSAAIPATINLDAKGGDGGDQILTYLNPLAQKESGGPGGSGAGGSIAFNSGAPIQDVSSGVGGVTNSVQMVNFPPNGATAGGSGIGSLAAPFYDLTALDVNICAGNTADLSVTILGVLPSGGTVEWYTQQFGGASINTGLTFTTPVLGVTTTYYVGVCPGTFRIPIVVTVAAAPNLVITDPAPVCSPLTVDITLPAVTVGSDAGTLTYWTDALATITLVSPTTVGTGTFYIQLDAGGGCVTILPVNTVVNPLDDATFTMTPTCDGGTASVSGTPGGVFTFNVAPIDAAVIDAVTGTVSGGTTGNSYDVLYTTLGVCPASLVVPVTSVSTVTYTAVITDENCGAGDGQIVLTGAGGNGGPYQYSITGGAPYFLSGTFAGLSANSYNISVIDNLGCEVTGTESVSGTGGPTIDNITPTNPTCAGVCDGTITVSVSGGTPPYSYQWYDNLSNPIGIDDPTLSGVCAGDYSVEVTDASGGLVAFFTEDFGIGCSQNNNANGTVTVNGAWTVLDIGVPDAIAANSFFISSTESGMGAGNCSDGCLATGPNNRTLHVGNDVGSPLAVLFCPTGDCGAAYDAFVAASKRAVSPVIDCTAESNISITLDYIHLGELGLDFGSIWYYDGAVWSPLLNPVPQVNCCDLGGNPGVCDGITYVQGLWDQITIALPASADGNPNVQIGIEWENDAAGTGADPSLAVDNIILSSSTAACPAITNTTLVDPPVLNLIITDPIAVCSPTTVDLTAAGVTVGSDVGTLTYWTDALATVPLVGANAVAISNTYYIQLDVAGCTVIQPVVVTINPVPNLVITDPAAVCSPATVDLTAVGVTVGSDAGTLTYWTDALATISLVTPTTVGTGTYYIQLEDANTCTVVQAVNATVNPLPTLVITDPAAVCSPGTVDLTTAGVTAGSDAGTLTYWTDVLATITLATPTTVGTGTYYIQLEDANGCTVVQAVNAVVTAAPNLVITDPAAVCTPGTVDITLPAITAGSDAGALTYWTDALATISLVTPTAVGTGTYYIQLDIGGGCTSIQAVNVTVNPLPNLVITDPAAVCMPGTVDITAAGVTAGSDAGALTYWGDILGTIPIPSPNAIPLTGTAYIQLVDANGCSIIQPVNVTVNPLPTLIISDPAAVCSPGTIDLTTAGVTAGSDAGTLTYWTDVLATITLATPTTVGTGTYYIQLEDANGCTVVQAVNAVVTAAPNLVITDPAAVCTPSTVDITLPAVTVGSDPGALTYWTDALATISLVSPTTVGAGTYYIQLDLGGGCSVIQPVTVTVNPLPNLVITDPTAVCMPGTIDLTTAGVTVGSDAGTLTYWTDALATVSLATPTTVGTGTYYIQLEDANTCSVVQAVNATVNPLPTLIITDPAAVCAPGTVDLTTAGVTAGSDAGTLTYWTDVLATITLATPTTVGTGTYYIQLENANGCTVVQAVNAVVTAAPNLVITDPAAVCTPGTVDITLPAVTVGSDAGALTYWTDALATISLISPTTVGAGTYYIQLDLGGGCSVIQPVTVTVNPLPNLVITDPAAVCMPGTIDLTTAGVTVGSDAGTLTYWTDALATVSLATPTTVGTGTYYIQLEDANTCSVVQAVNATVNPLPTLIITDPAAVCAPGTVDLTTAGVTVGSDAGTLTYWTDVLATITLATPTTVGTGTYYIQLENANGCTVVQAVNAVVTAAPNLIITDPAAVCAPGTVDITLAGVTVGSDPGALTYWTDALATISLVSPTTVGAGTYYIQLDLGGGCSVIQPVTVTVNPLPNLVITDPAAVCMPGTIDLTTAGVTVGSDAGTLTYWTDALATVSLATPTTVGTGTYYIQLEDANTCSVVQAVNATVNPLPTLIITDPAAVCAPGTVDLTTAGVTAGSDAGTLTYWTDAGATISLATPGVINTTNTYYIQLEDANTCTSIQPVVATINPLPNLVVTDPLAVCAPLTVDLTAAGVTVGSDAGALTYWTDAGATVVEPSPSIIGITNTYYIQLIDANNCSVIEPVSVVVNAIPNLVITDPAAACIPGTVDLTAAGVTIGSDAGTLTYWTDINGTLVLASPSTVGVSNTYYIQLEDANTCTSIQPVIATITANPNLVITDPAGVCTPGTVDLTLAGVTAGSDVGTLTYWTDAGATAGLATPSSVGTSNTYYIQLDIGGGCVVVEPVNVTINPLPNLVVTDPVAVCSPGTIDLTLAGVTVGSDAGTLTYWTDAGATTAEASPNSIGVTNTYYIQLEDANTCSVIVPVNTTINPLDDASFSLTPTCDGGSATIIGLAGGTFTFNILPGDGAVIDGGSGLVTNGLLGTVYNVLYTTNGICPASTNEMVGPIDCTTLTDIVIPTAFTPGTDGINDTWAIQDLDLNYPDNIVRVYNRWGNLIFEHNSSATNPYNGNEWDGTFNGELLPVASYYYIVDYNDGTNGEANGTVSIIVNK